MRLEVGPRDTMGCVHTIGHMISQHVCTYCNIDARPPYRALALSHSRNLRPLCDLPHPASHTAMPYAVCRMPLPACVCVHACSCVYVRACVCGRVGAVPQKMGCYRLCMRTHTRPDLALLLRITTILTFPPRLPGGSIPVRAHRASSSHARLTARSGMQQCSNIPSECPRAASVVYVVRARRLIGSKYTGAVEPPIYRPPLKRRDPQITHNKPFLG